MPIRNTPLITGEYYHVYNRGVNKQVIFPKSRNYQRFEKTVNYYQYVKPPMSFSRYIQLQSLKKLLINSWKINTSPRQVDIVAYVLMPNHYHFLLKQLVDNGISEFFRLLGNSYTRYINTSYSRVGSLFQGPFKAKLITQDTYLLQVSRYIHLNPYVGGLVTKNNITDYNFSSLVQYLTSKQTGLIQVEPQIILDQFGGSSIAYKNFCLNTDDYIDSIALFTDSLIDVQN